jgi:hypothetical protein
MGQQHMRNHEVGTATRTGTIRPEWPTIDRQPTEPFSVNLARCERCGDALRALAGGVWVSKRSDVAVCPKAAWRPWPRSRGHVISAVHPSSPWPVGWLLTALVVLGPVAMLVAIALAAYLAGR